MSYDLCVFNKRKAPKKKEKFAQWYEKITCWEGNSSYDDASVASKSLQKWYEFMLQRFPAMNGPDSERSIERFAKVNEMDVDEAIDHCADYAIDKDLIYVAFGYSQSFDAFRLGIAMARELGLGFYDPQEDRIYQCGGFVNNGIIDFHLRTGDFKKARKEHRKEIIMFAVLIVVSFSVGIWAEGHLYEGLFMGTLGTLVLCLKLREQRKFKVAEAEYLDSLRTELKYPALEGWLDASLNVKLPDEIKCFCFNIYEDADDTYSLEIVGYTSFDKNSGDWDAEEVVINRNRPLRWNTTLSSDDVLREVKYLIREYLPKGKYGSLLCSRDAVLLGFVDGDVSIVFEKNNKST